MSSLGRHTRPKPTQNPIFLHPAVFRGGRGVFRDPKPAQRSICRGFPRDDSCLHPHRVFEERSICRLVDVGGLGQSWQTGKPRSALAGSVSMHFADGAELYTHVRPARHCSPMRLLNGPAGANLGESWPHRYGAPLRIHLRHSCALPVAGGSEV